MINEAFPKAPAFCLRPVGCSWPKCECEGENNAMNAADARARCSPEGPTDTAPPRAGGVGWFCPMCDRHHAPSVETCPGEHKRVTVKINPMSWSEVRRSYAAQHGPRNPAWEVKLEDAAAKDPLPGAFAETERTASWLVGLIIGHKARVLSRGQIEAIVEKMWRKTGHDLWKMTPTEIAGKEGDEKTSRICLLIDAQTKAFTLQQLAAIVRLLESKTGFDLSDMSPQDIGKLNP